MSYVRPAPRQAISAVVRSRYPQIHSNSCRCNIQHYANQIQSLRNQNSLLRSQKLDEDQRQERNLLEDRLRIVSLQNEKLHERLMNYQVTMEELEKTHLDLVRLLKNQHRMKLEENRRGLAESRRTPTKKHQEKGGERKNKEYQLQHCQIDESLQGQYIVSLKKLNQKETKTEEKQQVVTASNKKPGLKLSYDGGLIKRSYLSQSPEKFNPESRQPKPTVSEFKQKVDDQQIKHLSEKIRFFENLLQQRDEENTKVKTNNKTLSSQNQLLKLKIKNMEENVKSCEQSIRHYQSEAGRLKKLIEQVKTRETTDSFTLKQNLSIKQTNQYLKRQIEELEDEVQVQKSSVRILKEELDTQKRKNLRLSLDSKELSVVNNQVDKLKKTIQQLNQQLNTRQSQFNKQQYSKSRSTDSFSRQILQIRRILQGIDLSSIQRQQHQHIREYKAKNIQLNHQISGLTSEIQRLKQKILIHEQKESVLMSDKEVLAFSAESFKRQNRILLEQIQSLEKSIEKYLQQEPLPNLKVSIDEQSKKQFGGQNERINSVKVNIEEIVSRLKNLEERLKRASQ